jgi:aspartyl-tRNA(Asn)/glutamyl-tRNA(Gln) amidotransferase subunit A
MSDFTVCTAAELVDLYQKGSAGPVAVTEQILNKIERLNPVLNAFCYTDPATTLEQARASAQRWQQNRPLSKLDGVPVAIKDSILTQGWPTLHASPAIDRNQPWLEDAPAVARLRQAGAIFVGKTTMPELAIDNHTSNSQLYGITRNPWNLKYTPGGSSGGSAVAVSAGMVPLALGSDFGGSISVPSAFCGIVGMKPSFGRVPRYPVDTVDLTAVGCMSRSVQDTAIMLDVISQPDVRDWASLPYTYENYSENYLSQKNKLRIAYGRASSQSVDPAISTATDNVAQWLAEQGAEVDIIEFDDDIKQSQQIITGLNIPETVQRWNSISKELQPFTSYKIQTWALQCLFHESVLFEWMNKRKKLAAKISNLMQSYDVILSPSTSMLADKFLIDNVLANKILIDDVLSNKKNPFLSLFSVLASATKQPTIVVPVGLNNNSMPVAIQVTGPMHGDALVLQVANAIQSAFPMSAPPSCDMQIQ